MHPELLEQVRQLPARERIEFVEEILEDISDEEASAEADPNLSPEEIAELDRRMAIHLANPESAAPWSEVQRRVEERFGWKL